MVTLGLLFVAGSLPKETIDAVIDELALQCPSLDAEADFSRADST